MKNISADDYWDVYMWDGGVKSGVQCCVFDVGADGWDLNSFLNNLY